MDTEKCENSAETAPGQPQDAAKPVGRPFVKGQTGNPHGRKPLAKDIRIARQMSKEDMMRAVIKIRGLTKRNINKIKMDDLTLGERAILNAYTKLDYKGIGYYEDRLWGKAEERVEMTGKDGDPIVHTIKMLSDEQLLKILDSEEE